MESLNSDPSIALTLIKEWALKKKQEKENKNKKTDSTGTSNKNNGNNGANGNGDNSDAINWRESIVVPASYSNFKLDYNSFCRFVNDDRWLSGRNESKTDILLVESINLMCNLYSKQPKHLTMQDIQLCLQNSNDTVLFKTLRQLIGMKEKIEKKDRKERRKERRKKRQRIQK